jgi:hypothetical protein
MGAMRPPPAGPKKSSSAPTPRLPVTITGVAPWAFPSAARSSSGSSSSGSSCSGSSSSSSGSSSKVEGGVFTAKRVCPDDRSGHEMTGEERLLSYMSRCSPSAATGQRKRTFVIGCMHVSHLLVSLSSLIIYTGNVNWHQQQASATPTLLPTLRFHDLVFGRDLGSGSFGTVRYARTVIKGSTQV